MTGGRLNSYELAMIVSPDLGEKDVQKLAQDTKELLATSGQADKAIQHYRQAIELALLHQQTRQPLSLLRIGRGGQDETS